MAGLHDILPDDAHRRVRIKACGDLAKIAGPAIECNCNVLNNTHDLAEHTVVQCNSQLPDHSKYKSSNTNVSHKRLEVHSDAPGVICEESPKNKSVSRPFPRIAEEAIGYKYETKSPAPIHSDPVTKWQATKRNIESSKLMDSIVTRVVHKAHDCLPNEHRVRVANEARAMLAQFSRGFDADSDLEDNFSRIEANLVMNISSTPLTTEDLSLLRRGIQFAVVGAQPSARVLESAGRAVDDFLYSIGQKLMREQADSALVPSWICPSSILS
jgi:hypothetical protein